MTKLKAKVTNALNETRMLILGAQILLGFQLNAVFQPRFERLTDHARWIDLAGLALMSAAVAFLIAPAPFHRLTEDGRDTSRLHGFTTRMAELALFPFGCSIHRHCRAALVWARGCAARSPRRNIRESP